MESIKFEVDKLHVAKIIVSFLDRVEHTVGRGENAGYQHLFLFPKCFSDSVFFFRVVKSRDCVVKV